MGREQPTEIPTCPVCGAPRLGHAWDCAKCGAVFDDVPMEPVEGGVANAAGSSTVAMSDRPVSTAATTSSAARSNSTRRGGAVRRRSSPPRSTAFLTPLRDWVDANKVPAIIISFVIYIGVVWMFGLLIIGGTDAPGAVKKAYRDVTGRPLPVGFGPAFAAHFVGRRLVVLNRPDQIILVLYADSDIVEDGELHALAERVLNVLEVPFESVRTCSASVGGGTVEVPVLQLVGEGGPHLYLIPTRTVDGGPAVEAVIGAPAAVLDVVDEMVTRR
jgi:hypothetical protein